MPQRNQPIADPEATTSTVCTRHIGEAPAFLLPSIQCDTQVFGRYVVILIPGASECLALCEVEIYGMLIATNLGMSCYIQVEYSVFFPLVVLF